MLGMSLLGTPREGRGQGKNKLEFTPIGKGHRFQLNQDNNRNDDDEEDKENQTPNTQKYQLNHGKLNNKNMIDSSFDNTADNFSPTINSLSREGYRNPQQMPSFPKESTFHQHSRNDFSNLIAGGMTSIKEQQRQFQNLETENYNLKIKLATLTRYFDQSPEDQKQLINQNIDLKQQLMAAAKQIDQLSQDLNDSKGQDSSKEAAELEFKQELESVKDKYEELLHKKEGQYEEYKAYFEQLEYEYNQLKESEAEHIDKIQDQEEYIKRCMSTIDNFNDALPDQLKGKISDLESENDALTQTVSDLKHQVHELDQTNYKLKANLNNMNLELEDKEIEINQLQHELKRWKNLYENLAHESESREAVSPDANLLSSAKEEIISLKNKVDELEYQYQTTKSQLEKSRQEVQEIVSQQYDGKYNTGHLQRQVEYMSKELKDRELIESKLRAQIDSLLRDQASNVPRDNSKFYEAQIESLSASETKLTEINKALNSQIAQLKDEIYHLNSSSNNSDTRLQSLQRRIKELTEKLTYYEDEYEKVESSKKRTDSTVEELSARIMRLESECKELQHDNEALVNQIKHQGSRISESAMSELETMNKRKLEMENQAMIQDIEALNTDVTRLKRELEFERTHNNTDELGFEIRRLKRELELSKDSEQVDYLESELKRLRDQLSFEREKGRNAYQNDHRPTVSSGDRFLESEYHRVLSEKNQLQLTLDENMNRLRDMENKYKRLQFSFQDKENLLDDMQLKLREMKRASKFDSLEEDDEKTQLLKLKASNEAKIKVLELEKESIKQEFESKVQIYKDRIDLIEKQQNQGLRLSENQVHSSIVALLEKQLEDATKLKHELSRQLAEMSDKQEKLRSQLENANKENNSELQEVKNAYEQKDRLLKLENDQLELKNKTMSEELDRVTKHCHKLVSRLTDLRAKSDSDVNLRSHQYLQNRIEDLNAKLTQTHISSPTPASRNGNSSKANFFEEQLKYYKAKLYDINLRANDLELMYSFVINSVKNSNTVLHLNEFRQLSKLGIYPDYHNRGEKKLTFSVVAKLVLSMVRMKRRHEKAERRRHAITELKNDIDRKKLLLE